MAGRTWIVKTEINDPKIKRVSCGRKYNHMRLYTPAAGGATAGRQEGPTAGREEKRKTPTVTVTSTPSESFGSESSVSGVVMFGTNNNYKVTTALVLTVTHLAEGGRKKVKTKL